MNLKTRQLFLSSAICLLALLSNCKKEVENWIDKKEDTVYDTTSTLAANRVISYKVLNTNSEPIYSSIDDQKKTITVYLPHYYGLYYMETKIELPKDATISPAETELAPVFSAQPFSYKVTAKDGSSATYTLNTIVMQPALQLEEFSSATSTYTASAGTGYTIAIAGANFVPSQTVTKLNVLDQTGKLIYQLGGTPSEASTTYMTFLWTDDAQNKLLKNTDYWLQIDSYGRKQKMQYPIQVNY